MKGAQNENSQLLINRKFLSGYRSARFLFINLIALTNDVNTNNNTYILLSIIEINYIPRRR